MAAGDGEHTGPPRSTVELGRFHHQRHTPRPPGDTVRRRRARDDGGSSARAGPSGRATMTARAAIGSASAEVDTLHPSPVRVSPSARTPGRRSAPASVSPATSASTRRDMPPAMPSTAPPGAGGLGRARDDRDVRGGGIGGTRRDAPRAQLGHGTGERSGPRQRGVQAGGGEVDVDVVGPRRVDATGHRGDQAVEHARAQARAHELAEAERVADGQRRPQAIDVGAPRARPADDAANGGVERLSGMPSTPPFGRGCRTDPGTPATHAPAGFGVTTASARPSSPRRPRTMPPRVA